MAPQFTSVPTKHVVRPLLYAPCPVMLPVLLTNIIPEQFPLPRMLIDIDPSRTPTPPPAPRRAPTPPRRAPTPPPAPRRAPTPPRRAPTPPRRAPTPGPSRHHPTPDSRESSLTPNSDDDGSDSSFTAKKPKSSSTSHIARPSAANIQTVKSLFTKLYPNSTQEEQEKEYTAFRANLDLLCKRYLLPSLALSHQDKDTVTKVHNKLTESFPWLAHYDNCWPVSVCLQNKLHNSAARAVDKSTRKAVSILAGVAPPRKRTTKRK
ncbi:hypothetical protein FB451DRAFT_1411382 [Mycena latifolia]|nr:hypothetical protein FB451DRAFT_1411382 [Mycena latifolia]